jgi:hypothetical protein
VGKPLEKMIAEFMIGFAQMPQLLAVEGNHLGWEHDSRVKAPPVLPAEPQPGEELAFANEVHFKTALTGHLNLESDLALGNQKHDLRLLALPPEIVARLKVQKRRAAREFLNVLGVQVACQWLLSQKRA